jgi:hypothetical protein
MDVTRPDTAAGTDAEPADRRDAAADELDVRRALAALHGDDDERAEAPPPGRQHRRSGGGTRSTAAKS